MHFLFCPFGEGGGVRKLGEYRCGMQEIWVVDRIVTGPGEVLKLFLGRTVSQTWGLYSSLPTTGESLGCGD